MAFFHYKIKDDKNHILEGEIEASNEERAAEILIERGYTILSLTVQKKLSILQTPLKFLKWVSVKDLLIFTRQLAVMIEATIPMVRALKILVDQTVNFRFKSIISELADEVEGGTRLSVVLARWPHVFSSFYINIVKTGEVTGRLGEVLGFLADQKEKDYDLMSRIKGAMIYPLFVLGGLVAVGFLMMIFVVPKLTSILTEANVALPLTTRALITFSNFLVQNGWLLFSGLLILSLVLIFSVKTKPGRYWWDYFKIKMPIFGSLFQKVYIIRLTRSLHTLSVGGVPLSNALVITSGVVGNVIYEDLINKTIKEVKDGNSLVTVFITSSELPLLVSQMLAVGEQTGRIEEMLEKVTTFYSRDLENSLTNLVTLIEPLVIVLMGGLVGLLIAAIILPMYNLAQAI